MSSQYSLRDTWHELKHGEREVTGRGVWAADALSAEYNKVEQGKVDPEVSSLSGQEMGVLSPPTQPLVVGWWGGGVKPLQPRIWS